jgi:hypothetical protein
LAQNPSFLKRQKELARLERQQQKQAKRKQRKIEKKERGPQDEPEIIPGPQPTSETDA